jgi:hypothetical protein
MRIAECRKNKPGTEVTFIAPDAVATLRNIKGWRLIALNGQDVSTLLHNDLLAVLTKATTPWRLGGDILWLSVMLWEAGRPINMCFSQGPGLEDLAQMNEEILKIQNVMMRSPEGPRRDKLRQQSAHMEAVKVQALQAYKKAATDQPKPQHTSWIPRQLSYTRELKGRSTKHCK